MGKIRIIQYGFGSLGRQIFDEVGKNQQYKMAGIVDADPRKVGMYPSKSSSNLKIVDSIEKASKKADIVLHTTVSDIVSAKRQFASIAKQGKPIISTCEELVYPFGKNKKTAMEINSIARKQGVCILGVGINPGFIMDSLVIILSNLSTRIKGIKVTRNVNLANRRPTLQKKMLVGQQKTSISKMSSFGHVGMKESANMICDYLGLKKGKIKPRVTPVFAKQKITGKNITVKKGHVAGINHTVSLKDRISLDMRLKMAVGIEDSDYIMIRGSNDIEFSTKIHGDKATVALLLNHIPSVLRAKPGLCTVGVDKLIPFDDQP